MPFGKKMGSLKTLKQSLAKGGGGGQWIKYIPKNGSMNVRFATEPEGWVNYDEHYDEMLRKSYPCNGLDGCKGCQNGDRKTSRYLANALDLDADNGAGRMIPLQMPKDLANRLVVKYEKWGTLMDRDIELTRTGEGLETIYDLDADAPSRRKMDKFTPHDLEKVLQDAWDDLFGAGDDDDDDDDDAPPPAARPRARKATAARRAIKDEDVEEDDDDEDEEEEEEAPKAKPAKRASKAAATRKKAAAPPPEPEFEEDDEDEEEPDEEDEPEEDEEAEVEYTIEELTAMPLGALRRVARDEFGVDPSGLNKKQIIKAIEDAPPF